MTSEPGTAGPDAPERFVERFEAFWAAPDPAALDGLVHPDVHLVQPMLPEMHTADAFRTHLRALLRFVPDLSGRVLRWAPTADGVLIEHTLGGTVGGQSVEWILCDRITLKDGKVAERIAYFDPAPLVRAVATRPRAWLPYLRMKLGH